MKAMQATLAKDQQGATLIVVLLVLLLIMVAGAMAVRQSRVDLQVATGDQINTALLQSADNANQKLESIINGNTSSDDYKDLVDNTNGLFGYFYNRPDRATDEFIYCQTATNKDYIAAQSTIRKEGGVLYGNGYCATDDGTMTYTSGRNVLVGQVSVTPSPHDATTDDPLSNLTVGQDINSPTVKKMRFDVRSTTAIPAYTDVNMRAVAACFRSTSIPGGGVTTVDECLEALSVPKTTVYQQANVAQVTDIAMCMDFGESEYNPDSNEQCDLQASATNSNTNNTNP